ncbi:MAG TPA: UDP-N-acetylmuramate dehydrogenase [Ferrovibrio sp.]|uniref:UDP-N-acetylmuramate dehydrogenase n=1 Tax=Ferrovibrio sp. TaxID=1917215 RepID=UPI002B4B3088|nr:UDP-N-acetylmuramate dehydrogenase [Ferrovibrio sp.]HLT78455.1 UDP-N-acetylmuramate dehydrogenase [Ferrovibrio sp.]
MMAATQLPQQQGLIARLPAVRGRLTADAGLADITWFRVGGPAEVMFRPADREDLIAFLRGKPADVPVTVLGVGSNTLVRDGGVPGVVIRLGRGFVEIEAEGDEVEAGAGALDVNVAQTAQMHGIAGLEFLRGIPGTIGGGLRMNAGAYGTEFKDVLVWAEALDEQGNLHRLSPVEMKFGYRHCGVPETWIFLRARLKGQAGDPAAIKARMDAIQAAREGSQPIRARTGGSTFANPDGHKAWQLVDAAGCRGLVVGDAQVSEQHCNFLINRGNATAADLETLGETVREKVKAQSGIELRWEIRRIGRPKDGSHG